MPVNHSTLAGPRHAAAPSPDRRRRGRLRVTALAVAAAASLGALTAPGSAPAEAAATKTYVGAAGQVDTLVNKSGAPMALHAYSSFGRRVPANADMISVRSSASWAQVAAAKPGSSIYNQIAAYAKGVKALNRSVMVAYHHEPEASGSRRYGNAEQFKAAYRKVVSIFNAQGATNVEWTLQMTAYSYRTKASDPRAVAKWYPGDAYVDNVGGDGYSWNGCEGHGGSTPVASLANPIVSFAKAHGKKASLPEFGVAPSAQRAQWLRDLHTYLKANRTMTAVFYFHNGPLSAGDSCTWLLRTAAEFDAYGDIARDTANFRS
jgi:beta-mannanase